MDSSVNQLESLRVKLAEFLCEDISSFKLEESFTTFYSFCELFSKAVEENKARKLLEEKNEARQKLKIEQEARKLSKG